MSISSTTWHDEAIRAYEYDGLSYQEIADRFGRTRATVIKLIKTRGVERRVPLARKGGRPKSEDVPPISKVHKALGVALNAHRTLELQMNYAEFANLMDGKSALLLKKMELGQHDFTLTELQRISEILGKSIDELIHIPQPSIYKEANDVLG